MKDAFDAVAKRYAASDEQVICKDVRVEEYFQVKEDEKKRSTKPTSIQTSSNGKVFGDTIIRNANGLKFFIDYIVKVTVPDSEKLPWMEAQENKRSEYSTYMLSEKFVAFAGDYNCCLGEEAKKMLAGILPRGRLGVMDRKYAYENLTMAIARGNSRMIDNYIHEVHVKNYKKSADENSRNVKLTATH